MFTITMISLATVASASQLRHGQGGGRDISNIPRLATPLVDIGSNLTNGKLKHIANQVVARATECNVNQIITGCDLKVSDEARKMCEEFPGNLTFTAGIHPHDVGKAVQNQTAEQAIAKIRALARSPHCVSIGETGLDYNRDFSPRDIQRDMFRRQVALACELEMPLFMHERDAHDDFMAIIREFRGRLPPVVMHCFCGTEEHAATYVREGFYIGIAGTICMRERGQQLRRFIANVVPLDRLMIETDAPYMGFGSDDWRCADFARKNEPCTLPIVAETLAGCYGVDAERIARETTQTTQLFFRRSFGVEDRTPVTQNRSDHAPPEIAAASDRGHVLISEGKGKGKGKAYSATLDSPPVEASEAQTMLATSELGTPIRYRLMGLTAHSGADNAGRSLAVDQWPTLAAQTAQTGGRHRRWQRPT